MDGQFGSAKGSFLALLIDARAVVFVASNSQSDSLDKLTTMLATSSMIPGYKHKNQICFFYLFAISTKKMIGLPNTSNKKLIKMINLI